jgi:SIR2-like domain
LPRLRQIFAEFYREWAWTTGREFFPADYYSAKFPPEVFIKHAASEILGGLSLGKGNPALQSELNALSNMGPHAIVTTNYDNLLEPLFPTYEVIIGQQIFRKSFLVLGEIFKIHGTVTDPLSMVLTEEDYSEFNTDKRYLSAKLLTYFAEHPLLFVGYGIEDQNIKNVLYDISRMFRPEMTLSPNIYILQWDESQDGASYPPRERVLDVGGGVNVRVKSITSSSFEWVFKAFGANGSLSKVDLKALRSLMARTVNLIRSDIPAKNVEVNYETLEHAISSGTSFANLFGVTTLNNPGAANANHPYTSQMLAEQLGLKHWTETNKLMDSVREVKQFDMKGSDNLYHVRIKTGKKETSGVRKYSDVAVELLKKVKQGMDYEIAQGCLIKI